MGASSMAAKKSFKMDRKSHFATKLKSLIFNQLLHFCPDYADDVLAEYITVLVCNGKSQNQATDDLKAFLGERSREFVSWLWHLLLKYERRLTAVESSEEQDKTSSSPPDADRENDNKNEKLRDLQSRGNSYCDNFMGERGKIYCSSKACESQNILTSEDNHLPSKATNKVQSRNPQSKFADGDSLKRVTSILGKHPSKSAKNFEESATLLGRRLASKAHHSHGGKPELPGTYYIKNVLKRTLSPLPLVQSSHHNKPRRSVWDRLGKPVKDVSPRGQITDFYVMNKSENAGDQCLSMIHQSTRRFGKALQNAEECELEINDDTRGVDHVKNIISQDPFVSNIRRKRHFSELSSEADTGMMKRKHANSQFEVMQDCQRPALKASEAVVSQVQDVKQRLRQVEIEMAKLRSKQINTEKDAKTSLMTDSGMVKPTEEDIGSRTILVTNVHNKATKDALSMYFRKCGTVVSVTFLTDYNPAPQRSAYITYDSKESADKALGLSGTAFYSRTITVSRKGDMAGVSNTQLVGSRIHTPDSHSKSRAASKRLAFPGSRLQWRRESLSSTPLAPASTYDQTKAAPAPQSAFHHEPPAASVSETAADTEQHLSASVN